MLLGVRGAFDRVRDHARLRVRTDRVEFGGGQACIRHQRPRVELRGGEQQHDLHDAVLGHDHHAIAATHAPFAQQRGSGIDGFQKLRIG